MERKYPIVWVIGATRSCKTALAQHGIAPLGFKLLSTGDYFRKRFAKPDTFSHDFVFSLSSFAAECLAHHTNCHVEHLQNFIAESNGPCVIEGERNPNEFAKLYDPQQDMVIFMQRNAIDIYDTVIERGIAAIEQIVRWNINAGIAPRSSAFKATFGDEKLKAEYFGVDNGPDKLVIEGPIKPRNLNGTEEEKYPWINVLIGLTREAVQTYMGHALHPSIRARKDSHPEPAP